MKRTWHTWSVRIRLAALAASLMALTVGWSSAEAAVFRGTLTVVWGDPEPGLAGGAIRFTLTLPNGTAYPLHIDPAERNVAIRQFGKPVVVQGRAIVDEGGRRSLVVTRLTAGVRDNSPELPPSPVIKRTLYILLRYSGDSQQPHAPQFYLDLTNPLFPVAGSNIPATLNGFFMKTSWGKLRWQADVAGVGGLSPKDWLTLPFPKSHYANCGWNQGCADVNAIAADGMVLALRQGVDVTSYDAVNFVLNNDLDCCSWGGSFIYNSKIYHGTWEAPWGQETAIYAHELGHALGLPHSGWVYYSYDSPWDVMSMSTPVLKTECGRYLSANNGGRATTLYCSAPGDGYIAAHKDFLGWIPAANEVVMSAPGTKTLALQANASALGSAAKLIKVCLAGQDCTGSHAHYLTVEARIRGQIYEKGEPGDGVIVHDFKADRAAIGGGCFFNNQSGWAVPVDAKPGDYDRSKCSPGSRRWPDYALGNAEFEPGQTYVNRTYLVDVAVLKNNASSFTVKVTRSK